MTQTDIIIRAAAALDSMTAPVVEVRSSLENPSTPLSDPDDWLFDAMGAHSSASGVRVSRETALTYSPVWRAVNLISGDVGKLPLFTYLRKGDGNERDAAHPAYPLLRYKPNSEMTAFIFKRTLQYHAMLQGNGYAYIFRRGDGKPIELIPMNPDHTHPVRENGKLLYVTNVNGEARKLLKENVLHIRGLGFDGLCGYSVYDKARDSFGLGIGAQRYGAKYFANDATPRTVIEYPTALSPEASKRLKENWNAMHQGLENSHKTAVLEEGAKVNTIASNAKDAQLLETRQFEIREVANWFGIPPHKLGDTTRTAFASLEQENQSYLDDALDPWLVNWEEECRDKLLSEEEKADDDHYIEFLRQALLRADLKTRAEYYGKALAGAPWMTVHDVRHAENLNDVDDEIADTLVFPLNMTPADKLGQDKPAAGADPAAPKAPKQASQRSEISVSASVSAPIRAIAVDVAHRMVKRIGLHARKAAKKPDSFRQWLKTGLLEHRTVLIEMITPAVDVCGALRAETPAADVVVDAMLSRADAAFTEAGGKSADDIAEAVDWAATHLEASEPAQISSTLTGN